MINPLEYQNNLRKIQTKLSALPYCSYVYNSSAQRLPTNYDFPFTDLDFEYINDELMDYITGSGDYELDGFDNVQFSKLPETEQNKIIVNYQGLANCLVFDLRIYALDFHNYLLNHTKDIPQKFIPSVVPERTNYKSGLAIYPAPIENVLANMQDSRYTGNTRFLQYRLSTHAVAYMLFALFDNSTPCLKDLSAVLDCGAIRDTNLGNLFGSRETVEDYINLFAPSDEEIVNFFYDLGVAAGYIIHLENRFAVDLTGLKQLYETVFTHNHGFDLSLIAHRFLVDGIERDSTREYATSISTMKAFLDFNYDFKLAMDEFFRDMERSMIHVQLEHYKVAASNISQPQIIEFQNQYSW